MFFSILIPSFLCVPWLFDLGATTERTEDTEQTEPEFQTDARRNLLKLCSNCLLL
jgi:hypothetical protein